MMNTDGRGSHGSNTRHGAQHNGVCTVFNAIEEVKSSGLNERV